MDVNKVFFKSYTDSPNSAGPTGKDLSRFSLGSSGQRGPGVIGKIPLPGRD